MMALICLDAGITHSKHLHTQFRAHDQSMPILGDPDSQVAGGQHAELVDDMDTQETRIHILLGWRQDVEFA